MGSPLGRCGRSTATLRPFGAATGGATDAMLALGVLAALTSAVLYAVGVTLQSVEARKMPPDESLRPALLRHLFRRPKWLTGTGCVAGGWGMQALALPLAPLAVVQPALAVSVVALLFIAVHWFGESLQRREIIATLAIVVGVAGLVMGAPAHSDHPAAPLTLTIGLTVLGLVALAPYALRGHRHFGVLVMFSAGLAYAWTGLATKFLADEVAAGSYGLAALWLAATGLAAGVGLLSEMTALQSKPAIRVFPVVMVVQILVAVLLAPLLAGESWSPDWLVIAGLAVSLGIVAAGTWGLAGAPAVERVICGVDDDEGPAHEQAGDLGEGRDGERPDHQDRQQEADHQRDGGRRGDQREGDGDHAGRRDRQPDEVLAVLD
jgi:drug/metabolite transporter (DMT)-like permease